MYLVITNLLEKYHSCMAWKVIHFPVTGILSYRAVRENIEIKESAFIYYLISISCLFLSLFTQNFDR
jgi:hypothetical protein